MSANDLGDIGRKQLWGRAAERCSMCNTRLTQTAGIDSVVGDEAHIRSAVRNGPRYDPDYPSEKVHSYENRILLCKRDHKLVDDNPEVFPTEDLVTLKARHERRVRRLIGNQSEPGWTRDPVMVPIVLGTQLTTMAYGTHLSVFNHAQPRTNDEAEAIGRFFDDVRDFADVANELDPGWRVRMSVDFHDTLKLLAELELYVVGGVGRYLFSGLEMDCLALYVGPMASEGDTPDDDSAQPDP